MSMLTAYLILAFAIGMIVGIKTTDRFTQFLEKIYFRKQDKKRWEANQSRTSTKNRSP